MPFNIRLREIRKKSGLNQQTMADNLFIALRTYQKYEQGVREPSYSILIKMAIYLNTTVDNLLCIDEYRP